MPANIIAQIANEFISGSTDDFVDIVTFVESPWGLGTQPFPVQRFIMRAYYGMPLDSKNRCIDVPDMTNERTLYTFTEVEFLKWLYEEGRCNTDESEGKNFQQLLLSLGRRAGKSTLASWISNYELYKLVKRANPAKFYGFPPNTEIAILNVAPTDDQSKVVFDMIQSTALRCPYLRDRSLHQTMTYFDLQTDSDREMTGKAKATLMSLAGGCSSNSLRGRNALIVIMDEMAFFIDNAGRFSGSEVYKALTPSIASFRLDGKVIVISSPYAKYGAFWDLFNQSFDEADHTLMFKMYSSMVNPTIEPTLLKTARRRDRSSFLCEYGAEFSDRVTAWVEDEAELLKCVKRKTGPNRGVPDVQYFMGIDLGFKNDGTALAICHKEGETIWLDYADVWFSGQSDVWEFEDSIYKTCNELARYPLIKVATIVAKIKELSRWFPIVEGTFDQHNGYGLAELFAKENMKQFTMTNFGDALLHEVYQLTKTLYSESLIDLFNHPVLVPELLTLEAEHKSKARTIVGKPNRRGAHDDISDAFVRAVWLCHKASSGRTRNVATGAGGRRVSAQSTVGPKNVPELQTKVDTYASFALRRRKMHGDHPRGAYKMKRRVPGAVMMNGRG